MARAPHLYETLRGFCLGAFAYLQRELSEGAELHFALEEHASLGRPSLYEYKPLAKSFVDNHADALARRDDARIALDELRREPAARIFARAHAGAQPDEDRALLASVLMPLLSRVAEACGAFDWDDGAFDRAYAELESSLFRESHGYAAIAPLVGLSAAATVELGPGLRIRHAATGEFASYWPEANGLLPPDFGREPDRLLVIEFERDLEPGAEEAPDAPGEIADGITAIRLATSGAVAAGPVLFERLDWRPYGVRPVVPIAATVPAGEATRLDQFRGGLAHDLLERLALCDEDPDLSEALDRWELSLFQSEPYRAEQLRESLTALLGGTDGLWAAGLRVALLLRLKGRLDDPDLDTVRRAIVEVLLHGDRASLVGWLDDAALGVRPGPVGYFAKLAASGPRGASVAA
ncbi:MAG: hypothetical protein WD689_05555 [Gaiellaceae bacterium]